MRPIAVLGILLACVPVAIAAFWALYTPGLDLYTPSDARAYVRSCARGQDDVYCKAMLSTLRSVTGPVSVLMPNMGDSERTDLIFKLVKQKGLSPLEFLRDPSALARANIFALPILTTGTHRTLDGRAHKVVCRSTAGNTVCTIDALTAIYSSDRSSAAGTVYATGAPDAFPFLPF
jgi:hypothetical protein